MRAYEGNTRAMYIHNAAIICRCELRNKSHGRVQNLIQVEVLPNFKGSFIPTLCRKVTGVRALVPSVCAYHIAANKVGGNTAKKVLLNRLLLATPSVICWATIAWLATNEYGDGVVGLLDKQGSCNIFVATRKGIVAVSDKVEFSWHPSLLNSTIGLFYAYRVVLCIISCTGSRSTESIQNQE